VLDGPRVHLDRVDLESDGAKSVAVGDVDLAHWPEQTFNVQSRVHFPRMRELFFKDQTWRVSGDGDFNGTFHLFKGGRDLTGTFTSPLAGVNAYRFPSLYGSLRWTPTAFEVWDAGAKFFGGDARFAYSIKPLGADIKPTARFEASADRIDLAQLTDFEELAGQRFAGTAAWRNVLEWPLGQFSEHRGEGRVMVTSPPGVAMMTASLDDAEPVPVASGRVVPAPLERHLPIAGELAYRFGPDEVEIDTGVFATERTHVT